MKKIDIGDLSPYYKTDDAMLFLGDSFSVLEKLEPESIDMVFADPPYFLSNDGITCHAGKMVSVNQGDWDGDILDKQSCSFFMIKTQF